MTTKLRTGLLLVFTAMTMTATLSGCIIETTSGGPSNTCSQERYFQVYWSMADSAAVSPWPCNTGPAFSNVRLTTNNGTYAVGRECRLTDYMGIRFDYAGSSNLGVPTGTYVITADLLGPDGVTPMSTAQGAGSQFGVPSCDPLEVAFVFELN